MNPHDLITQFRELSDAALLERVSAGTLIPMAQDLAVQELKSRGLAARAVVDAQADEGVKWSSGEAQDDLVTVARFTQPLQANVIRARLEAEGIFAFVAGEHLGTAHVFLSIASGSVQLQVPRRQEAAARAVLAAIERGDFAIDEEAGTESPDQD